MVMSMDASSDQIINSAGSPIDDSVARGSSLRHQESADDEQNDDEQSKDSAQTVVTQQNLHLQQHQQQQLQQQIAQQQQDDADEDTNRQVGVDAMVVSRGSSIDETSDKLAMNVDSTENDTPKQESSSSNVIITPISHKRPQPNVGAPVEDALLAQMREIVGADGQKDDETEKQLPDHQQQPKDSSGDSPENQDENNNEEGEQVRRQSKSKSSHCTRHHHHHAHHQHQSAGPCHHHHHHHHHRRKSIATTNYNNGAAEEDAENADASEEVRPGSAAAQVSTSHHPHHHTLGHHPHHHHHHHNHHAHRHRHKHHAAHNNPHHHHHHRHGGNSHAHHHHHHHEQQQRTGEGDNDKQISTNKGDDIVRSGETVAAEAGADGDTKQGANESKSSTSSFSSAAVANQKQQPQQQAEQDQSTTADKQQQEPKIESGDGNKKADDPRHCTHGHGNHNHHHRHHHHHHHHCNHYHHTSMQKLSDVGVAGDDAPPQPPHQHYRHGPPHHHHHCHHHHHHHRGHKKRIMQGLGDNQAPSEEPKNLEKQTAQTLSSLSMVCDANTGADMSNSNNKKKIGSSVEQMATTDTTREPLSEISSNTNKNRTCCSHHDHNQSGSGTSIQSNKARPHSHQPHAHPHHHHHHHRYHHRHQHHHTQQQQAKSSDDLDHKDLPPGQQDGHQQQPAAGTVSSRAAAHRHHHHHHHHRHHRHQYHHTHSYGHQSAKQRHKSKHRSGSQATIDPQTDAAVSADQISSKHDPASSNRVDSKTVDETIMDESAASKQQRRDTSGDANASANDSDNRMHLDQEESPMDLVGRGSSELVRMEMSPSAADRSIAKPLDIEPPVDSTASDSNLITCIDMGALDENNNNLEADDKDQLVKQQNQHGEMQQTGPSAHDILKKTLPSILQDDSNKVDLDCDSRGQELGTVSGNRTTDAPKQHQRVARQESSSSSRENSKRSQRGITSGAGGRDGANNNRDEQIDACAASQIVENSVTYQQPSSMRPRQTSVANNIPADRRCRLCWCCCCPCSALSSRASMSKSETKTSSEPSNSPANKCPSLPNVPLDEIRSWGESFDKLMKCEEGRKVFQDFLRCEYSEENILFWIACEELKSEKDATSIADKARDIYEDYISILSAKEVSLDSRVRDIINNNIKKPTSNIFDEAQLQIYTLMHRDSYPRFINSHMYKRLAQLPTSSRKSSS